MSNAPGVLRFKSFPKNMVVDLITSFITFRLLNGLLNGDMVFSRKTKVSCYKSEINKSVMLHVFKKKQRYRFAVFDKNTKVSCNKQKYRVTVVKKLATK